MSLGCLQHFGMGHCALSITQRRAQVEQCVEQPVALEAQWEPWLVIPVVFPQCVIYVVVVPLLGLSKVLIVASLGKSLIPGNRQRVFIIVNEDHHPW